MALAKGLFLCSGNATLLRLPWQPQKPNACCPSFSIVCLQHTPRTIYLYWSCGRGEQLILCLVGTDPAFHNWLWPSRHSLASVDLFTSNNTFYRDSPFTQLDTIAFHIPFCLSERMWCCIVVLPIQGCKRILRLQECRSQGNLLFQRKNTSCSCPRGKLSRSTWVIEICKNKWRKRIEDNTTQRNFPRCRISGNSRGSPDKAAYCSPVLKKVVHGEENYEACIFDT